MNIIECKEDSFEDRCGFLGPEIMGMLKEDYKGVGLYINDIHIDVHNPSKDGLVIVDHIFKENICLYITGTKVFWSHYVNSPKLNIYLRTEDKI